MREIKFKVWYVPEQKMYYRGYQKLSYVLLCEADERNPEKGRPVKKASYGDCELLESTGLEARGGREVFEGDIVRVYWDGDVLVGTVPPVPDMFKSRNLHPLHDLLSTWGIPGNPQDLDIEIIGNEYEGYENVQ